MDAEAPAELTWSIRLWPSSPLELASPLGNSVVDEFKRIRADSILEAHKNTTFARNSMEALVLESMTCTPVARRVFESKLTLCTTLKGRRVIRPVFSAAGRVAFRLLKYERVMHPLSQGPQ